jgi:hypothetical protein
VGIVLSLMTFGMAQAQAVAAPAPSADVRADTRAGAAPLGHRGCGPAVNLRGVQRCANPGPEQLSEGGCGFLQRCIYLSRSEQLIILAGGSATIVAIICGATALLGCAAASGLVAAAFQWLNDRGGACPTSKPKLKIRYFPTPAIIGCVA